MVKFTEPTSDGVSRRGLAGCSVVAVLGLADSRAPAGRSPSPVCGVDSKNWEISSGEFAALSLPDFQTK